MSIAYPGYGAVPSSNVTIGGGGAGAGHTLSITGAGGSYATTGHVLTMANGTGATWASTVAKTTAKGELHLEGENADIVINGVRLSDTLKAINDRLTILQPDPTLLSKYDNLRQAYEHYKTLEALLHDETSDE